MSSNGEFTKPVIPAANTKFNVPAMQSPMQGRGMSFGGFDSNKKVNNTAFGGINSDLIGRIVRDEKGDNDGKITQTTTQEASPTKQLNAPDKSNKNEYESSLKDIIELEKLRLLREMGKDKKQDKKSEETENEFGNDYPQIFNNKGNRLFDITGNQWYINNEAVKNRKFINENIDKLFQKKVDIDLGELKNKYNENEKTLKQGYDDTLKDETGKLQGEFREIKDGVKTGNFTLDDDLKKLLNNFMKRISYGNLDGKEQLKCSKESAFAIAQSVIDLAEKLEKEIQTRKANGTLKLDQSAINERKRIVQEINNLVWLCDTLSVNGARTAIELDGERMSEIYNGLNIFQRFWYALMDLIFGTNYNQEYNDIIAVQRLMIRQLNLADDESNPEKKYKHLLTFLTLSSKLDNIRENMATCLLYPNKDTKEEINKFKMKSLKDSRSVDSIFVKLFEICGGKMMSSYISRNERDKKRQYMVNLLAEKIDFGGVNPSMADKKKIISMALSEKEGKDIDKELELINEEDKDKKDKKIKELDYSVSSGILGESKDIFTGKTMIEKTNFLQAKKYGKLYLLKQKYKKDQIDNYENFFENAIACLDASITNGIKTLLKDTALENANGISIASQRLAQRLQPFLIGKIDKEYDDLLALAEKFKEDNEKDKEYEETLTVINRELESISSDKLSKEDKEAGKKPDTSLKKIKTDKFDETDILKSIIYEIGSIKKKRKEFYEKIQNAAKTNREKLINDVKNMLAPYIEDKSANFVSALQAHESNDNKHLSIYKDVENTKSKYDGRHYKDMKEVAQSKGGRGGFPGAAF